MFGIQLSAQLGRQAHEGRIVFADRLLDCRRKAGVEAKYWPLLWAQMVPRYAVDTLAYRQDVVDQRVHLNAVTAELLSGS